MAVEIQQVHLYPERQTSNLKSIIEVFNSPPEIVLSEKEREYVLSRETTLTKSKNLNTDLVRFSDQEVVGLETIFEKRITSTDFYIDYFLTPKGRDDAKSMGFSDNEIREMSDIEGVRLVLLKHNFNSVSGNEIGEVERRSKEFVTKRMVDGFEKNDYKNVDGIEDPTKLTIIRNPEVLVKKAEELRKLKGYLKSLKSQYTTNTNISRGMRVVIEMHRRRVNELLANLYPDAVALLTQIAAKNNQDENPLEERLEKSMVSIKALRSEQGMRNLARLDKFVGGIGVVKDENYTQLSEEALKLADEVSVNAKLSRPSNYRYKGTEDAWDGIIIDPEEFRQWGEDFLGARGVLSSQKVYDPDRTGPAEDDKWQAVMDPKATSLSVEHRQKAMKFPVKGRPIARITPAGAVPAFEHEGTHVDQRIALEKLDFSITDRVGMDRSTLLTELGGVRAETENQLQDFGQIRPVNAHYLRAVQARLTGGSYKDCFKAFFDSQLRSEEGVDKKKVSENAADRVLRLFRGGGQTSDISANFTNSTNATLEYLEQELLAREIKGTKLEKLFHVSGVNIEMLAELYKIGLFRLEDIQIPDTRPTDTIRAKIDAKIQKIA